ncbi:hypothetical protein CCE06_10785, partial [Streptococcus agalactiae]
MDLVSIETSFPTESRKNYAALIITQIRIIFYHLTTMDLVSIETSFPTESRKNYAALIITQIR